MNFERYSDYLVPYYYNNGYAYKFENPNEEYDVFVTTCIKSDGLNRLGDLREGEYLTKEDYGSDKLIGVFSSILAGDEKFLLKNMNGDSIEVGKKGSTFDTGRSIDIPNKIFFKITGQDTISNKNLEIVISGEDEEVKSSISNIRNYIKALDKDGQVNDYDYTDDDVSDAANQMIRASYIIIFITVINSISIAYLWVNDNKKEIIIRKVCGAKSINLVGTFFGRLVVIALISVVIALGLQWFLGTVFKGVFINLDIRLSLNNIQYSLLFSVGVAILSSIPAFHYISELQPAELLRGE